MRKLCVTFPACRYLAWIYICVTASILGESRFGYHHVFLHYISLGLLWYTLHGVFLKTIEASISAECCYKTLKRIQRKGTCCSLVLPKVCIHFKGLSSYELTWSFIIGDTEKAVFCSDRVELWELQFLFPFTEVLLLLCLISFGFLAFKDFDCCYLGSF